MGNIMSVPEDSPYAVLTFVVALVMAGEWFLARRPLRIKVSRLTDEVHAATSRERSRTQRLLKEQADGKKFYDLKLRVSHVEDLVGDGFSLEGANSNVVEAVGGVGLSIVSFLGYFNTGKTSLVARVCETADSPAGDERHTEGLSVKIAQGAGLKMACVDTEGLATPLTNGSDGVSYNGLRHRKTLEDFQRELASEISDCVVFVCDKISYRDQMDVFCLLENEAIKSGKKVIVVHNLRTVRDAEALAKYQADVFNMYGADQVQWETVDGPRCGEVIPTGDGPHRLVHTNGHYSQLRQVFLGDEDEPAMRALNTQTVAWLRTSVAECAKQRRVFGDCVVAGVKKIAPSYFVKLGEKYDVHLLKDTPATADPNVQRVVLATASGETPVLLPRDLTGLVPRKKAVHHTLSTRDGFYVLTFAVPGVSSKSDVAGMSVKPLGQDRIQIVFHARAPLVPPSACEGWEELSTMTSDGDTQGPKDVVDVDNVLRLPYCTGRFTFGAGGGVVWVRLVKCTEFVVEEPSPAPSSAASSPQGPPPPAAAPAAEDQSLNSSFASSSPQTPLAPPSVLEVDSTESSIAHASCFGDEPRFGPWSSQLVLQSDDRAYQPLGTTPPAQSMTSWLLNLSSELLSGKFASGRHLFQILRATTQSPSDAFARQHDLSDDERWALALWTVDARNLQPRLSWLMREANPSEECRQELAQYDTWVQWLWRGAMKLPDYSGTVYRAQKARDDSFYEVGNNVQFLSFTSCTTVFTDNMVKLFGMTKTESEYDVRRHGSLLIMEVRGAKVLGPLSMYPDEYEVLLLPGWTGTVKHVLDAHEREEYGRQVGLDLFKHAMISLHQA